MAAYRRPQLAERRRRVIYAHGLDQRRGPSKAAVAARRQARRPHAAYGARVHRRLRARWFALVPVRRRSLSAAIVAVACLAALLTLGHWAATSWAPLAYKSELARPLLLGRPDSFGSWLALLLLTTASVAAFLIYQLRRYRSDDYQGHYRIWRPVILVLAVAGLDVLVGLVDWGGALLDRCLGERQVLAGDDWLRLLLTVGGAALGLRLTAEIWRSRVATVALAIAAMMLAYPALVHWRFVSAATPATVLWLAAAPLWAYAAIWVAMVAYLRLLYRDVRQIDANDRLADRLREWKIVQWFDRTRRAELRLVEEDARPEDAEAEHAESDNAEPDDEDTEPGRLRRWVRWPKALSRRQPAGNEDGADEGDAYGDDQGIEVEQDVDAEQDVESDADTEEDDTEEAPREKRRLGFKLKWFGKRRSRSEPAGETESEPPEDDEAAEPESAEQGGAEDEEEVEPKRPRRWFGLRAARGPSEPADASADDSASNTDHEESAAAADATDGSQKVAGNEEAGSNQGSGDDEDAEPLDPESIDWSSMNKAERRRMRRELKRRGKAA
ncbi:ICP22 family protein [Roseimaritima sediminicola]|uniref:hypothetical protein n=1 Tax=Roseimaritima sediminicola TaxID=2662066 RepID=UPI001298570A|nr:hypothetical protein [Roseimaritima sediminicola]